MAIKIDQLPMDFPFLSAAIQKQSFITNYKHIYAVNDIKSPKRCSKNNFQNESCKLGFPNSSIEDDLIEFSYISIFYHYSKDFKSAPKFFNGDHKFY